MRDHRGVEPGNRKGLPLHFTYDRRSMMATDVILPALGMSQETGKIVQWLKAEGEQVAKGEPLAEIETDKATVEIEAPADGTLTRVSAVAGDDVPVGHVIAIILAAGEVPPGVGVQPDAINRPPSPLASRIAAEHNLDLNQVKSAGKRIQKADVLTYLQNQDEAASTQTTARPERSLPIASPKARRLASEQGKDLAAIKGSGPGGAVLAADVLAAVVQAPPLTHVEVAGRVPAAEKPAAMADGSNELVPSNTWRIMAERTTQGWTSIPHF